MRIPRAPRMFPGWVLAALFMALVGDLAPHQLTVAAYKCFLVILAGLAGYYLDRWAFPYARPHSYLREDWRGRKFKADDADNPIVTRYELPMMVAECRRAAIMVGSMLAVGMGL